MLVLGRGEEVWLSTSNYALLHVLADGRWERMESPPDCFIQVIIHRGRSLHSTLLCNFPYLSPGTAGLLGRLYFQDSTKACSPEVLILRHTGDALSNFFGQIHDDRWLYFRQSQLFMLKDGHLEWSGHYPKKATWVYQNESGAILIGHLRGEGMDIYHSLADLQQGRIAHHLLDGYSVSYIFQDREGGYWFATQEQGVFYTPTLTGGLVDGIPRLSAGMTKALAHDGHGTLYVGLERNGIFQIGLLSSQVRDISPEEESRAQFIRHFYYDTLSQTLGVADNVMRFYRHGQWLHNRFRPVTGGPAS